MNKYKTFKKLLILAICMYSTVLYSYEETVHMYITYEAYQLLKARGITFNFYENFLGGPNDDWHTDWIKGKITTGSYREDQNDAMYKIQGPLGFDWFVTNTHFWDADDRVNGDFTKSCLGHPTNQCFLGSFPNAYEKALYYLNGNWKNRHGTGPEWLQWNNQNGSFAYIMYQNGLPQFYFDKTVWYEAYVPITGGSFLRRYHITVSNQVRNMLVAEVIGRICHLLQDQTVPAHTHLDIHPPGNLDAYESYISHTGRYLYNHSTAGDFIHIPPGENNPLRYLFYVANQMGDHYPSGNSNPEYPGDNNLPGGTNSFLTQFYSVLGEPPSTIIPDNIAQINFNFAISVTAGLLYYIGNQIQQIENNLIIQNTIINSGENKSFFAPVSVTAGNPYTFIVNNGGSSVISSNGMIILKSGFHAKEGSNFRSFVPQFVTDDQSHIVGNEEQDLEFVINSKSHTGRDKKDLQYLNDEILSTGKDKSNLVILDSLEKEILEFEISNYPNPFNPITQIAFGLPKHSKVKLIIYNILGKEIAKLVDSELAPGNYKYFFDGENYPSGVYFYKLISDDITTIKKMMLLK